MKVRINSIFILLALLAVCTDAARAAVGFTVTPAAVSNTYSGTITLSVTGLPTGDTVVVQKFLDINTNGAIDAGDLLVQQFNLTEGQAGMVIGGVTNFAVPGDTDAVTGQITAPLSFQDGDFVQTTVGNYAFKLSSPAGHFTARTNFFTVTNRTYGQSITGTVVSNGTSVVIPNAVVLLFPPPRPGHNGPGTPAAAAVANSAGVYTIQVPPGIYVPMAFKSNYVANYSTSPVLALGGSQTITTNLTMTIATAIISGQIVDANNLSVGLPGVFEPLQNNSGLITVTFTDTNGNFTAPVTSGQWKLGSDDSGLIVHGYVGYQNGTNVAAGATGVIGPFYKATALFYGSVKDNFGSPLAGIDVFDSDSFNNIYQQDGFTDTNGNYVLGAVGDLGGGDPWQLQIDSGGDSRNPKNYVFSQPLVDQNNGTNLSAGTAVRVDFTVILATNHIAGHVQDNFGNPIVGVGVGAGAFIGGVNYYPSQVDTDTNGNYSLNVANGPWLVVVKNSCTGGDSDSLSSNYQCPNPQSVTIANNNGLANFTVQTNLSGSLQVATTSLPSGAVGAAYSQQLNASGGAPAYSWLQFSGTLPPGLGLDSNGFITGTPTTNGTFNFTAQVTDANSTTATKALTLFIQAKPLLNSLVKSAGTQFQFLFSGITNQNYTVQMSTNLSFSNWISLFVTNSASVTSFMVIDANATNPQRFYRVLIGP